jgi:HlyD family secretion protein
MYSIRILKIFAVSLFALPTMPHSVDERRPPPIGRTARVYAGVVESTLRLNGFLATKDSVTLLAPRLRGRRGGDSRDFMMTLQRLARPGARIKKGEVVAEFDPQYVRVRLDDRQADVEQRERSLRRLRAQLDVTLSAHRQKIKTAQGALDKAALDLKTIPVRSAIQEEILRLRHEEAVANHRQLLKEVPFVTESERAALRVQELSVENEMIELRKDEGNLERLKIVAPIDGIVVPQPIRRGNDMVEVGEGDDIRAGQPFVRIVETKSLIVEATVNQADVERLRLGQSARVQFDALPGIHLPGRVSSVGAVPTGGRYRREYLKERAVKVELRGTDERLFPNISASADVVIAREEAPAIVPRECVFDDEGGARAFVRSGDRWEERDLVLGLANNVEVAVLAGLTEGEAVATFDVRNSRAAVQ